VQPGIGEFMRRHRVMDLLYAASSTTVILPATLSLVYLSKHRFISLTYLFPLTIIDAINCFSFVLLPNHASLFAVVCVLTKPSFHAWPYNLA